MGVGVMAMTEASQRPRPVATAPVSGLWLGSALSLLIMWFLSEAVKGRSVMSARS